MAKKRYYQSPKARRHESHGMMKHWSENPDRFNDEHHRDKDPMMAGPYHYDRQDSRMEERSRYRHEPYAGAEPRRRQEMEDAGMIHEDHRAVANFPQQVIMRPYPKTYGYTPEDLDDTLRGVDNQIDFDNEHKMRHFYPKKV